MAGKKRSFSKGKKKNPEPITEEALDRFAGSSEEEDNADDKDNLVDNESDIDSDNNDDEALDMAEPGPKVGLRAKVVRNKKAAELDDDDDDGAADEGQHSDVHDDAEDDGDDSDDNSDFDQYENQQRQKHGAAGMASAMAKILGTSTTVTRHTAKKQKKTATGSAVLSKTVTPLQRQLQKEKGEAKVMREKRREKAVNPLPALHIPLSVATTSMTLQIGSKSVAEELEQERLHRRVATRGVVALFNAVAQHQKKGPADNLPAVGSKSTEQVKKMTKHGFLDMIKTAAVTKRGDTEVTDDRTGRANDNVKGGQSKWQGIQDDYMLNPKKVRFFLVHVIAYYCCGTCKSSLNNYGCSHIP